MRTHNITSILSCLIILIMATSCGSSYNDYYSEAGFDEAFLAELSPEERAQFLQDYYGEEEDYETEEYEEAGIQAQYVSNGDTQKNQIMKNQGFQNSSQAGRSNGPTKTVQLIDRGYGMVMATVQIPQNWNVQQNLATNRQMGSIEAYQLDYYSPNGELIRLMKPTSYSSYYGQSFQSTWNQLMQQYLYPVVQGIRFQQMTQSRKILSTKYANDFAQYNFGKLEGYEQRFTGTMSGRPVEGVVYGLYLRGQMEQIIPLAVISPQGHLAQTIQVYDMIDRNCHENPQYVQLVHGEMGARAMAHNKRMMNHNNRTKQLREEIYSIHQQQREDFNRSIREEGLGYNGSRHTINDQVTDAIRGEMTIENSWSGEQERVDQSYKYWYTNPLGQKYGTNNPSFNPQTLPGGNWRRANSVTNY